MGFSLKSWAAKNLTLPKEFKQINIGKTVRNAAIDAVHRFEDGIKSAGSKAGDIGRAVGGLPQTVDNVNAAANTARTTLWIAGGAIVLVSLIFLMRKR